jgi:hypothetical protein
MAGDEADEAGALGRGALSVRSTGGRIPSADRELKRLDRITRGAGAGNRSRQVELGRMVGEEDPPCAPSACLELGKE